MLPNSARQTAITAVGLALAFSLGLGGCQRTSRSGLSSTRPGPVDASEVTEGQRTEEPFAKDGDAGRPNMQPPPPEETPPQDAGRKASESANVAIEIDEPQEPEPKPPPYLSIVERIRPARRARVRATPIAPRKLVVTTRNVRRLRLTREGLPLAGNRSIVLQIDGQGIEWTPKYLAVELERSPAGAWTVVRRRPVKP